ncbi:MAG: hypothetical protein ACHQK8_07370 [Bacteroidia bacterium]
MKKSALIILAFVFLQTNSSGQVAFGISPGLTFNSAYAGYKFKSGLVAYAGFQFVNIGMTSNFSGQKFDYNQGKIVDYTQTSDFSGNLYIPNIGAKYFFKNVNKLKAYFSLNISKPILGGSASNNGVPDDNFKSTINNTSIWGGELGFGVEYFFDDNFSVGGEFGLRYLHYFLTNETPATIYNPSTGASVNSTSKTDYTFILSPTYTKFSLNYYF